VTVWREQFGSEMKKFFVKLEMTWVWDYSEVKILIYLLQK